MSGRCSFYRRGEALENESALFVSQFGDSLMLADGWNPRALRFFRGAGMEEGTWSAFPGRN